LRSVYFNPKSRDKGKNKPEHTNAKYPPDSLPEPIQVHEGGVNSDKEGKAYPHDLPGE
jgi:hypothetical protein